MSLNSRASDGVARASHLSKRNCGEPLRQRQKTPRPLVAIALPGGNSVELAVQIVKNVSGFDFLLYAPDIRAKHRDQLEMQRVRYTTDFVFFLMQSHFYSAALTLGCLPHTSHMRVVLAVSMMRQMGIPVIDVQHGLFQWGVNFIDRSVRQGFASNAGISLPIETLADLQVTWGGPDGIGYPHAVPGDADQEDRGTFALVATNTNWHIYSDEERAHLMRILQHAFEWLPDVPFIWKPHPAEFAEQNSRIFSLIADVRANPRKYPNVRLVDPHDSVDRSLSEIVSRAALVIATLGTAVLDCELWKRPCAVYKSPAVTPLLPELEAVTTFSTFDELIDLLGAAERAIAPPVTGQLAPFRPDRLESILSQMITARSSERTPKDSLGIVLDHIALARSIGVI